MNTIISSQNLYKAPYVTSFKGKTKFGMHSIKSTIKNCTGFPEELNGLKQKYFNEYRAIDKILIKLRLKQDNSEEMAVLAAVGVKPQRRYNGTISVERFCAGEQAAIRDMGLDESKIFKRISDVRKNAEFDENTNITSLENLESVNGNLYLAYSKVNRLGRLRTVGKHVYLNNRLNEKDFSDVNVYGCILK